MDRDSKVDSPVEAEVGEEEEMGEEMAATEIEAIPRNDVKRNTTRNDDHRTHRQAVGEVAAVAMTMVLPQNRLMAPTEVGDAEGDGNQKKLMK